MGGVLLKPCSDAFEYAAYGVDAYPVSLGNFGVREPFKFVLQPNVHVLRVRGDPGVE